jgi:peptidoglycan hydrolase-like protein with peptidoglycan-binding domain
LTPDEIRDLQGKLKAAGFNPGPIDGTLGSQTRGAVRKYAETRAFPSADVTRELLARLQAEALAPVPSQPGSSPPVPQQVDKSGSPREPSASQILSTAQISSTPLTRDEIRDLQSKLKATGYNPGAIDGAMGRQTRSAVREYAEDRALPTTDATGELLSGLKVEAPASVSSASVSSSPVSSPPVRPQVDKSDSPREPSVSQILSTAQISSTPLTRDEIRDLQSKLKAAGYNPGSIDGAMGSQTQSAVREYAEDRALPTADATRGLLEP